MWGEWRHEGVEPRVAHGALMSGIVKGPFYWPAWRVEVSGGGWPAVEFNSAGFEE
jgi:hypothetical protein